MEKLFELKRKLHKLLRSRVTVMLIPNAGSNIKQVRLQTIFVYSIIFFMISIGLFLSTSSVILYRNNIYVSQENQEISQNLMTREDKIEKLNIITEQQQSEIKDLKESTIKSAEYFNNRFDDLLELERQVNTLVSMLNKTSNAKIDIPTNRSGEARVDMIEFVPTLVEAQTIEDAEKVDEISQLIRVQLDDYSKLVEDVESQLNFMACKPDQWPAKGRMSSPFGNRKDPVTKRYSFHKGIDIANTTGTKVTAAGTGVVTFSGWNGSYGNVIVISHGYGYKSVYAHNEKILVEVGQRVEKGDYIAKMGSTGKSTGSHLHFEIHFEGTQIDPMKVLEKR